MDFNSITKNNKHFDDHKLVSFIYDKKTNLQGCIAIHRGNRQTPSFGATRIWNYASAQEALIDALKLSKLMSYKAALAGLNCGGAKAVIMNGNKYPSRKMFLESYADKVNLLGGNFITGADVGVERKDVILLRRYSPYFVGVKVDPVRFTGLGIFYAIKAALDEVVGSESLGDRSFAIQGVGKVGQELLKLIYPYTHHIYISDIKRSAIKLVKERYPDVKVVDNDEIHRKKVDVFSPCALSGCLNKRTVKQLHCKAIVGGANNQLEEDSVDLEIYKKGILYAPDYLVNAGGLISVFDEFEHEDISVKRIRSKVLRISSTLRDLLGKSKNSKRSVLRETNKLAEEICAKYE